MKTRHPSYLPLELMACGAAVVTNRNPYTGWLLRDGENCVLAETSPSALAESLFAHFERIHVAALQLLLGPPLNGREAAHRGMHAAELIGHQPRHVERPDAGGGYAADRAAVAIGAQLVRLLHLGQHFLHQKARV